MLITTKNFRGISKAEFELSHIQLVGGQNGAGKSSLAQAVGAVLSGESIPVRGVKKTEGGQLVHAGTAKGSVSLSTESDIMTIEWPKASVKSEGKPPAASPFAVGLSCVLKLPPKEMAETMAQYLDSEPTREDFDKAVDGLNLSKENIEKLWQSVEKNGWDGAHAIAKEKGAKLKGQWEDITGDRYGKKKAEGWLPENWDSDLDGASEDDLQARVTDAQDDLEAAIAAAAVDDSKRSELEEKAGTVADLEADMERVVKEYDEAWKTLEAAKKKLAELPSADQPNSIPCPYCEKPLAVSGRSIEKADKPLSAAEVKKREKARDKAQAEVFNVEKDWKALSADMDRLAEKIAEAKKAAETLAETKDSDGGGGDVDKARNVLDLARRRLQAWQDKTRADSRHNSVVINQEITALLSTNGLRLKKLAEKIKEMNDLLANIVPGSWGTVEFDSTLAVSLSGTPYHLLSKSERWRVRIAVQLAMAKIDKSAAVVIDGADILADAALRNGLFTALVRIELPSVVTMAFAERDKMPDISKIGKSWWLEEGVLKEK